MATAELPQAEDPVERERREIKSRMLRALWIPIVAVLGVGFYVLNFSRLLISGKGNPAIVVAALVTIIILGGATIVSAAPRMRTSSLVMLVAGGLGILLAAGSVVVGHADEHKASGPKHPPFGPPVGTLNVTALPSLTFDAKAYSLTGGTGTYTVNYIDGGGTHTLVFDDPSLSYFQLGVPGGPKTGQVILTAGKTYTIYCTIPGHRQAGMQATVTVGAGGPKPAAGATGPTTATTAAPK
ncbi:MAG TPA: plastocyanin/azurin family copper-binding protein [Acidimicrobiia bacterium]|jgi:plastocyanin